LGVNLKEEPRNVRSWGDIPEALRFELTSTMWTHFLRGIRRGEKLLKQWDACTEGHKHLLPRVRRTAAQLEARAALASRLDYSLMRNERQIVTRLLGIAAANPSRSRKPKAPVVHVDVEIPFSEETP
jgi:hypothetical protein